ncbi:hypothetical protein PAJ34TS1_64380 [Paenibacillus azoreducens]|uniref:Uncharacterized protein n=1 Tax=Paenibacillus azoreducens TaxID=116718 RepID=A0A919YG79_9BACL|nr:hypothetical protein J34TS1_58460 [Paenibacillus azoreducens]
MIPLMQDQFTHKWFPRFPSVREFGICFTLYNSGNVLGYKRFYKDYKVVTNSLDLL